MLPTLGDATVTKDTGFGISGVAAKSSAISEACTVALRVREQAEKKIDVSAEDLTKTVIILSTVATYQARLLL